MKTVTYHCDKCGKSVEPVKVDNPIPRFKDCAAVTVDLKAVMNGFVNENSGCYSKDSDEKELFVCMNCYNAIAKELRQIFNTPFADKNKG